MTPTTARACTCHGLDIAAFDASIAAGASTVKACFRHHDRLPKCGDCTFLIRERLAAAGTPYGSTPPAPAPEPATTHCPPHRPTAITNHLPQESLP